MSSIDEFFDLPEEVQRGFVKQFRIVLNSAIDCGDYIQIFGDSMTVSQFKTISDIVNMFDKENSNVSKEH